MIVTQRPGAIVTNPARRAVGEVDPLTRRHQRRLEEARPCRVDLYTRDGKRFARLIGDDRQALEERAARWQSRISPHLDARWPDR